ncbi:hypothetical protein Sjap_008906 [Stephania japonica]|uniref:Uncharacterized protein n=1 Tax=Stephania japonica TaxID=461633 RepID=A0AAP0JQK2_9MAGN
MRIERENQYKIRDKKINDRRTIVEFRGGFVNWFVFFCFFLCVNCLFLLLSLKDVKLSMKLVARFNLVGANPLCFSSGKIKSFMNIDSAEEENQSVPNVSLVNEYHFDDKLWFTTIHNNQRTETP